jgi:hypothetical protein
MKRYLGLICGLIFFNLSLSFGQPAEPDEGTDNTPPLPLDGGVSLLIGAAALYGAKKLRDKRKQDEQL